MSDFVVRTAGGVNITVEQGPEPTFIVEQAAAVEVVVDGSLRGPAGHFFLRGEYSAAIAYNADDLVTYGGSSYAKKAYSVAGTLPTNTTHWQLISGGYDITVGTTPPSNPTQNSLWVDTN